MRRPPVALGLALPGLLLLVCSLACANDDLGATPQLLANGGFETGTGAQASNWGLWPPTGSEAGVSSTRDATIKHSGSYSGRLQVTRDDFKGLVSWHHNAVPVQAGQELVLRFWMKAEGVTDRAGCDVQFRRGPQEIVGSAAVPETKGAFDWRLVTHTFRVPAGVDHVCVVPVLYGQGTVWFDDLVLHGTPALQPARLTTRPKADGDLSDPCWRTVQPVSGLARADGSGLPQRQTSVWVAYDPDTLYFAFRCEKKPGDKLRKTITKRDGTVWVDDAIEVFLNPRGDRGEYYQFVVNALGTRYDSRGTDASWNANWQAAARDRPGAWTVEMAIPLRELPLDLTTGQTWCANFGRDDQADGASSWSCVFGGFHSPGRFGRLEGMALNLVPCYERDARARIASVRTAYESAISGLDLAAASPDIAAPFREREPRIRNGLEQLEVILRRAATTTAEEWAQVRPSAAALATDIGTLRAASLRLRAWSLWRSPTTPQPRFGLATAPAMVKVRKDGQDFAGTVAREISLFAARNEYESGQVVVVSLDKADLPDCQAEVSPLCGPGNATIPAASLKLGLVGYVKTAQPGYATSYVGDWPDPIMPLKPFTLKAGEVQPLWLRCYVPPGSRTGDYRGTVTVTAGTERRQLVVKLHVFHFDLPRRQHLATPFGCAPGTISQWYTGSADYEKHMPVAVWKRWNRFLLDYRLTPTHVADAYLKQARDARGEVRYDYSIADQCLADVADRLPPEGVAMAGIGGVGWSGVYGATLRPSAGDAHGGQRAGQVAWPKIEGWASLSRGLPGREVAARGCRGFRFWVKALDPAAANETIVAFTNAFPIRWVTTFQVGGTDWHEVRLPLAQFHNNETGVPLTLEALKECGDLQFVVSNKPRPLEYLLDDVVAECEDSDFVIDDFEVASEVAAVKRSMGEQLAHWKAKGWLPLGHVYAKDEIQPAEYEQILPSYRRALQAFPGAPLMQTYYVNRTPRELIGVIRIWCAITSIYDEEFLSARRQAGEKTWLYVCCGPQPPYANFFIDEPGIDHRVLFWQTWQRHCTGLLCWEANYWHGMMPTRPDEPRWPDVPWDQTKVATYREFKVNGDGFTIYPGPNWEPWPSVRLENIRDGIEDYEYLWLLRERNPRSPLLQVGSDISADFTHFTKDPWVIEQRRLAIAKAIEAAKRR